MNRRRTAILFALVLLSGSYLLAGGMDPRTTDSPSEDVEAVPDSQLIQPADNGSYLWPYTSRSESVRDRTLAINVIVHAPPERTRTVLTDASSLDWQETNESQEDAGLESYQLSPDDGIDWDDAAGSTRYSYIDRSPHGGSAEWVDESYQLHTGAYLGSRYHIRGYSSAGDDWTAIQVHQEYFDWFRLRHTVTDIDDSARLLESEFIDQPFVEQVSRNYYGLRGGWSDGWISEIDLAAALVLLTVIGRDSRTALIRVGRDLNRWAVRNRYGFVLAAGLCGLLLGIRAAGIAMETMLPAQPPQVLAGLLYPAVVVGPPVLVATLAPRLSPVNAFGFTLVGMGAGFVYDFAAIGLGVVPVQLVLHRIGLVTALGLFAVAVVGSHSEPPETEPTTGTDPTLTIVSGGAWLLGLAFPLFGYL